MNKKGKTIAIYSSKGGVGKTIFALNLAGVYANNLNKVLLLDFDLQGGGVSLSLNLNNNLSILNLANDLNANLVNDVNQYISNYNDYIDVISCPKDPRDATLFDYKLIPRILNKVSSLYDVILIDMSHSLNEINLNVLDNADNILYLITNDPLDLKNSSSMLNILKETNKRNYAVILNNSVDINREYYSFYDIKNIIKTNVDYIIPSSFFINKIDKYIIRGQIPTLNSKLKNTKGYKIYNMIAKKYLGKCGDIHE